MIGRLETPVVCAGCRKILEAADTPDVESIRSNVGREVQLARVEMVHSVYRWRW